MLRRTLNALTPLRDAQAPVEPAQDSLWHVLEQSVDAAFVIDSRHRVVLFNPAAETLWRCRREEVHGLPFTRLLGETPAGGTAESTLASLLGSHRDATLLRPDGSEGACSVSMSKVVIGDHVFHTAFVRDTSDQQRQLARLRQLSIVVDSSDNAIFISSADREVVYVNSGFTRMLGYRLEELRGIKPAELLSGPHTDGSLDERISRAMAAGEGLQTEVLLYTKAGRPLWLSTAINPVHDEDGSLLGLVSVLSDITQTKMHQVLHNKVLDALVHEWNVADVMTLICREVEHIAPELTVSIITVDSEGLMHALASPSLPEAWARKINGLPIGPRAGVSGVAAWRGRAVLVKDIASDPLCANTRHLTTPLGLRACWTHPIKSSSGRVLGTLSFYYRENRGPEELHERLADTCLHLCSLTLEREQTNERVHQLAFYDTLTGLPNRIMFSAKAEQALANVAQGNGTAAVLFIDLDRFKRVNDAQGHAAGDGLLRDVAARLSEELGGINIVGRQAGDEFVAVLPMCSAEQAGSVAERLLGAIAAPTAAGLMTLHPSASIGVAMFPDDGRDIDLLVRHADMAMYRAKRDGGSGFRFFSVDMNRLAQERVSLETALRDALRLNQLNLQYQPQVGGCDGRQLYGVEALLRWHHADLGVIPPSRFVPVAEECGLIADLSLWVLRQACAQMADWRRRGVDIPRVSVNVSAINFRDPQLSLQISDLLDEHGLVPDDLTLEITESVMLDPDPDVLENIEAIYVLGVRLSLDDFGTGYSSLSHLHRLPISELKLDQSFVRDIDTSAIARTLTSSVLRIGESLGMKVVAEGVETESQHRFLTEQRFPVLQGYLFSPPLPPAALEDWLGTHGYASVVESTADAVPAS
ncbi:EAL domain-containing protein [Pseudoxanthomonas sp. PXM01]|uniref:EAL domain-containing protein n=1 Tax=Pseudoxanthomonas sp. PXM01 TaxID=2769295 RepID=UPI0017857BC1|nr:EAL domain-containing protein [Pseudoxanthomonas sp. PXM01]MBD9467529.1 EAL domain-containing protein [Pseudoxanthomonas sp. PXM01]